LHDGVVYKLFIMKFMQKMVDIRLVTKIKIQEVD